MNELYELIEKKIKESGYPRQISGADVYDDICDQIDGKENGTYLLLSKFEDDVIFEYHITINDEDFNLGVLTMKTPEGTFMLDATGKKNGRGAYVCPSEECLQLARKNKGLERSFKQAIPAEVYESLEKEMEALETR